MRARIAASGSCCLPAEPTATCAPCREVGTLSSAKKPIAIAIMIDDGETAPYRGTAPCQYHTPARHVYARRISPGFAATDR